MSTESAELRVQSAEDVEYGPTPPGAKYEHTDIDPEVGYKFALWLAVSLVLSVGIVYGTFWYFERQQVAADAAVERFPLAVDGERPEPTPALQKQPFHDITALRQEEAGRLGTYGWVDKEGGVARIPIDRAMEILLQKGLPVRPESVSSSTTVVQDSSSGRTSVPR